MAQGAYIGVNGVARKITGGYVGVNDKARKIIKAYIGIGGVARPCWSVNKELTYYGTITSLSTARSKLAATSVGNYALFGGGQTDSTTSSATVDAYDTSLTRSTPTSLFNARYGLTATSVGDYAIFFGGVSGGSLAAATIDYYDKSLTRTTPTPLLYIDTLGGAATTLGDYAMFGGGDLSVDGIIPFVFCFDKSLTRKYFTTSEEGALSVARYNLAATTVGNYAIFAGGQTDESNYSAVAEAYTVK